MPRLYSAGSNSSGQLSIGHQDDSHNFVECQFADPDGESRDSLHIDQMSFGSNHTLALCSTSASSNNTELFICGSNEFNQLGYRQKLHGPIMAFHRLPLEQLFILLSAIDREKYGLTDPTKWTSKSIACSWSTSFLHLSPAVSGESGHRSDLILALGSNDWNERGILNNHDTSLPQINVISLEHLFTTSSSANVAKGHQQRNMIRSIESGPRHVLAIVEDTGTKVRKLIGWGAGRHGQLSSPITAKRQAAGKTVEAPTEIEMSSLSDPSLALRLKSIAAGRDHSLLFVQESNSISRPRLVGMGSNKQGQLGSSSPEEPQADEIAEIVSSWTSSFTLTKSGQVFSWGSNKKGQLGRPTSGPCDSARGLVKGIPPMSQLAAGSEHVLALDTARGDVWGWGWNEHGNLGLGHLEDVETPTLIWSAKERGSKASRIWCGNATCFILT